MKVDTIDFVKNKPQIFCFYVDHSGSTHLMHPVLMDLQEDYKHKIDFYFYGKGEDQKLEKNYNIYFFPTLLILCNEEVIYRFHGLVNRDFLYNNIKELLLKLDDHNTELNERN